MNITNDAIKNTALNNTEAKLRKIGKITGVHGLKGEIYIYVFSKDVSWIGSLNEITIEDVKGVRKILKIESLRPFKDGFLAFVDGVNDRNVAESLRAHLVYVDGAFFTTEDGDDSFYLAEIEGFQVFDKDNLLGPIESFGSNTIQDLIVVRMDFGLVEIPLVEDFLVKIDFEAKEVRMTLPEGLIEVQRAEVK